jgi:two-component system, chemotaxis family, chemotaxis protein CheY
MAIHQHSDILIVDDSSTVRNIVRKLLTDLGFKNVDEASDGAAALTKIQGQHFDLVISDWNMDSMNGEELLRRVRADERCGNLPFIMMTADSTIDKIVQAKDLGVSCYIIKPFGAEGLQAKIMEINNRY